MIKRIISVLLIACLVFSTSTTAFAQDTNSTRWTLHEHLLFQRRLCRKSVVVMSKQKEESGICHSLLYYF